MSDPRRGSRWAAGGLSALVAAGLFGLVGTAVRRYDRGWKASPYAAAGRAVVGAVEEVTLVAWGLAVPARVDTGAAVSSLDARDVRASGHDEVEFSLPDRLGGRRVRTRRVGWQTVRTSDGEAERRPVVELEVALGAWRFPTRFTLNDRSRMDYPMLIGRNTLEGRFLVDVTRGRPDPSPSPSPAPAPGDGGPSPR